MQHTAALVRLQLRRLGERPGLRAARLYSIGIFVSYALLALLADFDGAAESTPLITSALESSSCVVAGLSALACAADLSSEDERDGVALFTGLHGVTPRGLECSRTLGALVRTATAIAAPAWGLIVLVVLTTRALLWALALALGISVYATALAVALVLLSRLAARFAKGHGKLVLALSVLVPELVHAHNAHVPSWSSVFGEGLEQLRWLGEVLA